MKPLRLVIAPEARADLKRRTSFLHRERGPGFAFGWARSIGSWMKTLAESGVALGTLHPERPGIRTFPYKGQATMLVEFTDTDLRIIRIYFTGQDWLG